jgi:hypothetical protein
VIGHVPYDTHFQSEIGKIFPHRKVERVCINNVTTLKQINKWHHFVIPCKREMDELSIHFSGGNEAKLNQEVEI